MNSLPDRVSANENVQPNFTIIPRKKRGRPKKRKRGKPRKTILAPQPKHAFLAPLNSAKAPI